MPERLEFKELFNGRALVAFPRDMGLTYHLYFQTPEVDAGFWGLDRYCDEAVFSSVRRAISEPTV